MIRGAARILAAHAYAIYRATRFASRMDLRDVFATNLRRLRNAKGLSGARLDLRWRIPFFVGSDAV
jgi:hypothetical protein